MDRRRSFFDGQSWNHQAVVEAQRQRAEHRAMQFGVDVSETDLLSTPVPRSLVERFEREHAISLPEEYRSFLLTVGDGGVASGLLMRPLGAPFNDTVAWEPGEIYGGAGEPNLRLDKPFPFTEPQQPEPEFRDALEAEVFPDHLIVDPADASVEGYPGLLYLVDHGAAIWDALVITGECRGEMWADRVPDGEGCYPITRNGDRSGFAAYYCAWLSGDA